MKFWNWFAVAFVAVSFIAIAIGWFGDYPRGCAWWIPLPAMCPEAQ
jgi:hypothetical protein